MSSEILKLNKDGTKKNIAHGYGKKYKKEFKDQSLTESTCDIKEGEDFYNIFDILKNKNAKERLPLLRPSPSVY